ncbi:MAG: hypothetical protein ACRDSR_14775 [Pseudonocardiaceae bacterium]
MLSEWELGRHTTSVRYRKILSAYYVSPPDVLFAHQDAQPVALDETPRLLVGYPDLRKALVATAREAEHFLAIAGSRSRDKGYLNTIEISLAERPGVVHYRILFGPPRHPVLVDHLLRLLELRDPDCWSQGLKTPHIGLIDGDPHMPERFFCVSEQAAVVPIPSLNSAEVFDSGVLLGPKAAERLIDHTRQCYAAARRVESADEIQKFALSQG